MTTLAKVVDEDGYDISEDQLEVGDTVYWEDENLDAYPVTLVKVIGESARNDHFVLVIVCVILLL